MNDEQIRDLRKDAHFTATRVGAPNSLVRKRAVVALAALADRSVLLEAVRFAFAHNCETDACFGECPAKDLLEEAISIVDTDPTTDNNSANLIERAGRPTP